MTNKKHLLSNRALELRDYLSIGPFRVKTPGRRGAALALASLALVSTCTATASAQTQTPKPNIASEVESGPKKTGGEKETPRTPEANKKQPGGGGRHGVKAPVQQFEVTFTTDMADAEIFLHSGGMGRMSLGKTGADGKLKTRLSRGVYEVTATRIGQRIQSQRVDVRPGNTDFSFTLALPPLPPKQEEKKEEAEAAETPTPETDKVSADKALAEADELIKRFLDAKETGGVKADDWRQSLAKLNAALETEPDNSQLKARVLIAQGQLAFLNNDYPGALVAFNKAAQETPGSAAADYGRGNVYLATNQPVEAFKAYQHATELNAELGLAFKGMGDALLKQGKQKEANQYYARAKNVGSAAPSIGLTAARSLKQQKRWAQALKEFRALAESQPSAEIYIEMGDCYMGLEQPLSASQAYRKAVELEPKLAPAHYKYGEVMYNLNEFAAATEALERALALDPTGASINRKRAREMANKAAEKARKMD